MDQPSVLMLTTVAIGGLLGTLTAMPKWIYGTICGVGILIYMLIGIFYGRSLNEPLESFVYIFSFLAAPGIGYFLLGYLGIHLGHKIKHRFSPSSIVSSDDRQSKTDNLLTRAMDLALGFLLIYFLVVVIGRLLVV